MCPSSDGTNCGIALSGKPVFSVQHHPVGFARAAGFALPLQAVRQSDPRTPWRGRARRKVSATLRPREHSPHRNIGSCEGVSVPDRYRHDRSIN